MTCVRTFVCFVALAATAPALTSCRTVGGSGSEEKGFSAVAEESNIAVIMNSYGHTPEYGPDIDQDTNSFAAIIADPTGGFRFKTLTSTNDDAATIVSQIEQGAAQVSTGGTLLVFLTAHGSTNGMIQSRDSAYVDIGYPDILAAITRGRQGRPFRRLVLMISACYSASWFDTMQSSNGLIKERLAISSTGPNTESVIGQATGAMLSAFRQYAKTPNVTMAQFLQAARQGAPAIMYVTTNDAILNEPLLTPKGDVLAETNALATGGVVIPNAGALAADVVAMTSPGKAGLSLIVYAKTELQTIELYNAADGQWYGVANVASGQPGYPSIRWLTVNDRWTTLDTAKLRVTSAKGSNIIDVSVVHK